MSTHLNWRYATKKFDSTKKLSSQELDDLLEALRLSPSSFGLQPWKFIVVKDHALRAEIRKNAWNQTQVTDASDLIVLCSLKNMDEAYIKNFIVQIAQVRGVSVGSLVGYEQQILGWLKTKTAAELNIWMKRQVYIALGILLSECALKKIDACPMEGFDPVKVDEILGLSSLGLESVTLCPVGFRATDDHYADLAKVRFTKDEVFLQK